MMRRKEERSRSSFSFVAAVESLSNKKVRAIVVFRRSLGSLLPWLAVNFRQEAQARRERALGMKEGTKSPHPEEKSGREKVKASVRGRKDAPAAVDRWRNNRVLLLSSFSLSLISLSLQLRLPSCNNNKTHFLKYS